MRLSKTDMDFGKSLVCKYVLQLLILSVILSKLLELTGLWFSYLNNEHNIIYPNGVIERIKGIYASAQHRDVAQANIQQMVTVIKADMIIIINMAVVSRETPLDRSSDAGILMCLCM